MFRAQHAICLSSLMLFNACGALKLNKSSEEQAYDHESHSASESVAEAKKSVEAIVGSSKIKSENLHKAYFLYGAEHLNLGNYYFDIPVVYNKEVKKWMDYFQGRGRAYFERYSARAGRYAPVMSAILEELGMPKDLIFLAMAESGFQNKAKSWARAVGPWQFMPFTGKRYGLRVDWYVDERQDPIKATIAAAKYLAKLYAEFGSWELAAAAYNAGEGKMGRAIRRYNTENFWDISKGKYLKSETKNYVPKIMALAIIGKNLTSFGFQDIDFHETLDFEEISVPATTDLYQVSEKLNVDFEEMQRLNPELMRWFTPPDVAEYVLRVPVGSKVVWDNCCSNQQFIASNFKEYTIKSKRATLAEVANKFKVKPEVLEWLNGADSRKTLGHNEVVRLPFHMSHHGKEDMYSDLYERPRKEVVRRKQFRSQINTALQRGKKITNPSQFYTVQKGDTLWDVARKNGVSLDNLIASNIDLIKSRMIRAGDRLIIR